MPSAQVKNKYTFSFLGGSGKKNHHLKSKTNLNSTISSNQIQAPFCSQAGVWPKHQCLWACTAGQPSPLGLAIEMPFRILWLTGGIPGRQGKAPLFRRLAMTPPVQTGPGPSIHCAYLRCPACACSVVFVSSDITGSPRWRLSLVSGCRWHRGSSRARTPAVSAWAGLGLRAGGPWCRGGSGPGLSQVTPAGRRSWAWCQGCRAGEGGGGRRRLRRQRRGRQRGAYCPAHQRELCEYAGGPAAPLTWRNVCHTALLLTPSYRRVAGARSAACSRRCRAGGTGWGWWRIESWDGGSEGGVMGT